MKKSNGVTLISLVITIIVLIILASISVYSGKNTIKSSKFTKFKTELEIMQSQVNMLNEKYKKKIEELPEGAHFNEIGEEISLVSNVDEIFTEVGENDKSGYRYYDKITLKDLGIDGLENEFLVNVATRKVISRDGFEYEGTVYYTLEQITQSPTVGGLLRNENVTVEDIIYEKTSSGYKITLQNIDCSKYVGEYQVKYKKVEDSYYTILDTDIKDSNYSFTVDSYGVYNIQVIDAAGKTTERSEMVLSIFDGITFSTDTEITMVKSITDNGITTARVMIPEGFTISGEESECAQTKLGVDAANERKYTIDDGVVVYLLDGATIDWSDETALLTAQQTYDQFVWVPVKNAVTDDMDGDRDIDVDDIDIMIAQNKYPMAIETGTTTDDDGNTVTNYRGVLYEFTLTDGEVVVSDVDWSEDSTGNREPAYLDDSTNADTSSYNNVGITESLLQSEFNAMVTKVRKNKGFWVGRYETSNMVGTATTSYTDSSNTAKVEADTTNRVTVIKGTIIGISYDSSIPNCINWYRMYAQQKNYSNLANIKSTSSMIWGNQWDQIMIWMKEVENESQNSKYIVNSIGMANFGSIDGVDDGYSNTSQPSPTGCFDVKNIYDLAGNVYDWTLEANNTSYRVICRRSL